VEGSGATNEYGAALELAVAKNLHLVGSTLGSGEHLRRALGDHASGALRVPVDSVWGGGDIGGFLYRTFCDSERRGKVVYLYG
jgi:hypothetical protein